jgi:hypothetical protein
MLIPPPSGELPLCFQCFHWSGRYYYYYYLYNIVIYDMM